MSLTVLLSTRAVAQSVIAHFVTEFLPGDVWELEAQSGDGRSWRLHLAMAPSTDPVQRLLLSALRIDWMLGMEFATADSASSE
ncbi:hypothetical protein [Pseudomonas boanensis]|uniref:hypothetical protein n=1 Tax=Metapseudomonas boanensis TaxID=2822138 RepID=UPI0035D45716